MVGTSDTTFAPEETITRAMFVTILARYAKAETDNNAETAFTDVPSGQYYTGAVAWAAANGIVNGTSAVTFAPNDPVTREQMAALLYRAMRFLGNKCPQDGKLDAFSDASALSDWAVEGMIWAAGAGLFGGFEDGTLRPQETAHPRAGRKGLLRAAGLFGAARADGAFCRADGALRGTDCGADRSHRADGTGDRLHRYVQGRGWLCQGQR